MWCAGTALLYYFLSFMNSISNIALFDLINMMIMNWLCHNSNRWIGILIEFHRWNTTVCNQLGRQWIVAFFLLEERKDRKLEKKREKLRKLQWKKKWRPKQPLKKCVSLSVCLFVGLIAKDSVIISALYDFSFRRNKNVFSYTAVNYSHDKPDLIELQF